MLNCVYEFFFTYEKQTSESDLRVVSSGMNNIQKQEVKQRTELYWFLPQIKSISVPLSNKRFSL